MRISDWSSDVCSSDLQYTRANRTQEGAGGHSRYLVRARRKANIELLVRNQLPDGGRTMRVEMDRNARMSFLERADHKRQETERECGQRGDMRSEERSVGKEWVSTCRSRWSASRLKKTSDNEHSNRTRNNILRKY